MQESRIDDYWNIDGSRDLSDSWTGFTQFTLLEEKPPDGYMWSGERVTKRKATSSPDHLCPELWTKLEEMLSRGRSTNGQLKNQSWIMLEDYFIDPEDKEFLETIRNARKKLETPIAPAMRCKTSKKSQHRDLWQD